MMNAFFSDPVNIAASIVFFLGMAFCAVMIPMTVRRTRELREQNDHKHALAIQKRGRHAGRQKRVGRHSLRRALNKIEDEI